VSELAFVAVFAVAGLLEGSAQFGLVAVGVGVAVGGGGGGQGSRGSTRSVQLG
jgi:enoyl-CoA hydratase/carnithine racemase